MGSIVKKVCGGWYIGDDGGDGSVEREIEQLTWDNAEFICRDDLACIPMRQQTMIVHIGQSRQRDLGHLLLYLKGKIETNNYGKVLQLRYEQRSIKEREGNETPLSGE